MAKHKKPRDEELEQMTVEELREVAAEEGVALHSGMRKDEILATVKEQPPPEQQMPPPESSFAGLPGAEVPPGMHPDDLPPPAGRQEPSVRPALDTPASTDRPGEEDAPARFLASRGRPVRPEDFHERPAGVETAPGPPQPRLADPRLPLPRVCHQNERAYPGATRYKVRAEIPGNPQAPLYILAPENDERAAVDCYARALGLDRKRRALDENGALKEVSIVWDPVIVRLPD
jgi:hypothetical protein